jgi:membrane-associated protease RseP (regulator of RpoE activity)
MRGILSDLLNLRLGKVGIGASSLAVLWFALAASSMGGATAWAQSDEDEQSASSRSANASDANDDDDDDDDADRSRSSARPTAGQQRGRRSSADREHPQLGVSFYGTNSLQVRRVVPGSPAEEAGIRRGDTIQAVNGQRVSSIQQLKQDIDEVGQDGELKLGVLRNGRQQTLQADLTDQSAFRGRQTAGRQRWNQPGRGQAGRSQFDDRESDNRYARGQDDLDGNSEQGWSNQRGRGYGGQASNRQSLNRRGYGNQGYGNQGYGNGGPGNQQYTDDDDFYGQEGHGAPQRQGYANQSGRGSRRNRPFLGVTLDEEAQNGVWVTGVYPNSPAEQAGVQRGDEILSVDDQDIESYQELVSVLAQKSAGEEISLEIDRNGRQRMIDATLASSRSSISQGRGTYRTGSRQMYGGQNNGEMYQDGYRESGYGNRGNGNGYGNDAYDNQGGAPNGYQGGYNGGTNRGNNGQFEMGETPYGQSYWQADRKVSGY